MHDVVCQGLAQCQEDRRGKFNDVDAKIWTGFTYASNQCPQCGWHWESLKETPQWIMDLTYYRLGDHIFSEEEMKALYEKGRSTSVEWGDQHVYWCWIHLTWGTPNIYLRSEVLVWAHSTGRTLSWLTYFVIIQEQLCNSLFHPLDIKWLLPSNFTPSIARCQSFCKSA